MLRQDKPVGVMQASDEMEAALQDFSLAEQKGYWLQVNTEEAKGSCHLLEAVGSCILRGRDTEIHSRGPGSNALGCSHFLPVLCQGQCPVHVSLSLLDHLLTYAGLTRHAGGCTRHPRQLPVKIPSIRHTGMPWLTHIKIIIMLPIV